MLYLLNSGVSFQSVPSVAIVGPELRYSWLLEVREIRFLHTIWIPLVQGQVQVQDLAGGGGVVVHVLEDGDGRAAARWRRPSSWRAL